MHAVIAEATGSWIRKSTNLQFFLGLIIFVIVCTFSINKPLSNDEVEFASPALAVSQTGEPIWYLGDHLSAHKSELDIWIDQKYGPKRYFVGHSNLYVYLIGLSFKIFGASDWSARLIGALCILISLFFLRRIIFRIFSENEAESIAGYTSLLFLINPFILQQGLMLDLDNTIVTSSSLFFFDQYLKLSNNLNLKNCLWLSFCLLLVAWTKETAIVFLMFSLLTYEAMRRRKKGFLFCLFITGIGTALFAGSWIIYCRIMGYPEDFLLEFSYLRRMNTGFETTAEIFKQEGFAPALIAIGKTFAGSAIWASPFLYILFAWSWISLAKDKSIKRELVLFLIFVGYILIASKIVRPSLGTLKYEYPAYPFMILFIGHLVHKTFGTFPVKTLGLLFLPIVAGLLLQLYLLGDPFYDLIKQGFNFRPLLFGILPFLFLLVLRRFMTWKKSIIGALALSLISGSLAMDLVQTRDYTTSASWLSMYGEKYLRETGNYLIETVKKDDKVVVRKDVGFRLMMKHGYDFRWTDSLFLRFDHTFEELQSNLSGVQIVVLDSITNNPRNIDSFKKLYHVKKNLSHFLVLAQGAKP